MSNFEYIVASLPVLLPGYKYESGKAFSTLLEEIRENLSEKDNSLVDFLLKGFDSESLNADFYAEALSHRNRFIREYFRFDLNKRNAIVRRLNEELGREEGTDIMTGEGTDEDSGLDIDGMRFTGGEFEEERQLDDILSQKDLLTREKGLDDLTWNKVNNLTVFNYFDINAVLGFLAKLHIADRWLTLDEEQGRERFRTLVSEIKGTFKGIKYDS
ncbi:MAG: DUF2764 family protein [Bacteroidales bacterium]|nr:DUF2764 family protein [Bacteroidales bacterium]